MPQEEKIALGLLGLGAGIGASAIVHRDTIAELRKINAKLDVPLSALQETLQEAIRKIIREELGEEALKSFPKYVALTFDDGTANTQYNTIKSIISKYKIPVTLFIETDPTGTRVRNTYNEPAIAEPDQQYKIKELHDTGLVEIGSHSVTHPNLTQLSEEQIEYELKTSKETLESIINAEVKSFAYPFGYYNTTVLRLVQKYYKCARATNLYIRDEYPLRPTSRYKIMTILAYSYLYVPMLPAVILRHNEALTEIESIIRESILPGTEFLTFSEFVEKVQKLPRLGVKITLPYHITNATSQRTLTLGSFEGEVEMVSTTNNPQSTVEILGNVMESQEYGGVHTTATTYKHVPSFQNIYDLGGTDVWEVQKWDTSNNIYIIRTRKPLPAKVGLAIRITPATGSAISLRCMTTYHI